MSWWPFALHVGPFGSRPPVRNPPPARCADCKWMVGEYGWQPTEDYHSGFCRRHAPIGTKESRNGVPGAALWPYVRGGDSCGDFEPPSTSTSEEKR